MLNKQHITKAIERYNKNQKENVLIHPISLIDVEIIKELLIALNKLGHKEIAAIMEQYKYKKDTEIQENLLEWNTNYTRGIIEGDDEENIPESGSENIFFREFIKIKDGAYELRYIYNYDKCQKYDIDKGRLVYYLIINNNSDPSANFSIYANTIFDFNSEQERDEIYDLLEETMRGSGRIVFIN